VPPDHSGDRRDIPDRISDFTFHNRRRSPVLPKPAQEERVGWGCQTALPKQAKPSLDMLRGKIARHDRACHDVTAPHMRPYGGIGLGKVVSDEIRGHPATQILRGQTTSIVVVG
jgi:hypothetical protein